MIVIIDYGMGNVGSIVNMLKKIGTKAVISADPEQIRKAEKIILPGVGAFDTGMAHLNQSGVRDLLEKRVLEDQIPTIGICLGMQLLMQGSEEGNLPGLGWIDGKVAQFQFEGEYQQLRVPHMGWNTIRIVRENPLLIGLADEESRFYFVHSYYVRCDQAEDVLAVTNYGFDFASILQRGNIFGTQFHPEKSHRFGMQLLRNFVEYKPC